MSVYVFNLLVGFSPNGIDNAQGYREKMFDQIGLDSKYVFTEFPDMRKSCYIKILVSQLKKCLLLI